MPRKKKKEVQIGSEEKRPRGRPRKKPRTSDADYLMHRPMQKRERLRADPKVSISSIFEKILTELRNSVDAIDDFMKPVDKKYVPG